MEQIVITYGTFDLLHHGHLRLLQRAKKLGNYLIVGVTSDAYDRQRGKLNVQQTLSERMEAVRATGLADLIIAEEYEGQKISDIQKYKADIFAIGSDWKGKFDYLEQYCHVVYLERTKGISSTSLRTNEHALIKLGCVGMGVPTDRFLTESKYVSGIEICACYQEPDDHPISNAEQTIMNEKLVCYTDFDAFFQNVDAVYIAASRKKNYFYIKAALNSGKHVICESPMFLNCPEAKELLELAARKQLVLMEALKTLYFPAFEHLLLLIGSRIIGDIVHIDVSCSQCCDTLDHQDKYEGSMFDFGSYVLLPIFKLIGFDYTRCSIKNLYYRESEFCEFTAGYLEYPKATAMFKVGKGVKTEGDLIITGSNGYIYVPSPWWKLDYFEVRYEDLRNTRKFFYKFDGEGLRYEINEFVRRINQAPNGSISDHLKETYEAAKIIERFEKDSDNEI